MSRKYRLLPLGFFALSLIVLAAGPASAAPAGGYQALKEARLKLYDKDGDGKLSEVERAELKRDLKAKRDAILKKYDQNNNGRLDADERAALKASVQEFRAFMGKDVDNSQD